MNIHHPYSLSVASFLVLMGGLTFSACSSSDDTFSGGTGGDSASEGTGGDSASGGKGNEDAPGGMGGENSDEGTGGERATGGSTPEGDTVSPEVVGVLPNAGTDGVEEDEPVTITFSEPMDVDSVATALTVSSVSTDVLDLSWNDDNTVLNIIPSAGWDYAEGASELTVKALEYSLLVSKAATDLAGNKLEKSGRTDFTTLRRISKTLSARQETRIYAYAYNLNPDAFPSACTAGGATDAKIGFTSSQTNSGSHYIYLDFNLGGFGSAAAVEAVESATLTATQTQSDPDFYPTGTIGVEELTYGAIDVAATRNLTVKSTVGDLGTSAAADLSLDIKTHLWELWSAEEPNVAYRLRDIGGAANNKFTYLGCNSFRIDVIYLTH